MSDPILRMPVTEIARRITIDELLLGTLQREADTINRLLDIIESGGLDDYLKQKSDRIKEVQNDIDTKKLIMLMKESGF